MMKMKAPSKFIPFARPAFSEEEEKAAAEVLRSGWVSTGKACLRLEAEFTKKLECAHACAVNSATAGLHLSLKALNVTADSFVLTTPFTFTSTAEVCRYENAHPLFADIEERSFNIDPDRVEEALLAAGKRGRGKKKTVRAMIPVHIAGRVCDMNALLALKERYNVPIIEDAAHSFPVKGCNGWAGTIGDIGVFSFYATKPISTGEGGMVVTNNGEAAKTITNLRLHGIDRIVWDRYHEKRSSWEYDVIAPGYKYNLSDILAAIGLVQLTKADLFLERRKEIARRYAEGLGDEDYLITPEYTEDHGWHLYILRIRPEKLTINRDEFLHRLCEANIGVSVHFRPLHLMSYYRKTYGLRPEDFPVSLSVYKTCFSIPVYYGLTDEEQEYIIEKIREIGRTYRK